MKDKLLKSIMRTLYQIYFRPLLVEKVNDTESDIDNVVVDVADAVFKDFNKGE